MMKLYYVYILTSHSRVLYIGVTGNLEKLLAFHRSDENPSSFTFVYRVKQLVEYTEVRQAISREKQLKSWSRAKKIALIDSFNPRWEDLAPAQIPRRLRGSG
jgi:putative endonuclease